MATRRGAVHVATTKRVYKGKTYTNHLLVESVMTPEGPRQRTVCSLGNLEPAPREQWCALAHKLAAALQGQDALPGQEEAIEPLVEKAREGRKVRKSIVVDPDRIDMEEHREAGPVHVGHQLWRQLGLDEILARAGLSERACLLSEVMTLNRLIFPLSELSMPDWIRRTALGDILETDFSELAKDALYRNLDRLHPQRETIERELAEREKTLFNLDDTIYLYDLTSTYFEGEAKANPQAKLGYSRDKRADCKQVLVGLVLDRDGFPKAHEIFEGNRQDRTTVDDMLGALEKRTGKRPGATVVVDRGMAFDENLDEIRSRGFHYLVAGRQSERNEWLDAFEEDDWEEVLRTPSVSNPFQEKSHVAIKCRTKGDETYVLCVSEGRREKDKAIRAKQEKRLIHDLERLQKRIATGHLKKPEKIHEAIGRLKERYPRVARYYLIDYHKTLTWEEDVEKKAVAEKLDGSYVLKTDRQDLSADEIWRTYILLSRVESAFRSLKSPLAERPIFHHLKHRTQTHIFLCVLAYHLVCAIEKRFLDHGIHTSWWTIRQQLSTHQVATIVLPTDTGMVLKIRKGGSPDPEQRKIYEILKIPSQVMKPVKTWHETKHSD